MFLFFFLLLQYSAKWFFLLNLMHPLPFVLQEMLCHFLYFHLIRIILSWRIIAFTFLVEFFLFCVFMLCKNLFNNVSFFLYLAWVLKELIKVFCVFFFRLCFWGVRPISEHNLPRAFMSFALEVKGNSEFKRAREILLFQR